jgi:ribonuclease HI
VRFVWIKGHNDDPENELCDRMAVEASRGSDLSEDQGYVPESDTDDLF